MNGKTVLGRRGVAVLGSTGSVGRQTLDVLEAHADRFRVVSLAARSNSEAFANQIARFRPAIASLARPPVHATFASTRLVYGSEGLIAAATHPDADIVVVATSGHGAIVPTMRAIEAGKTIAMANKEALVCAGELIMPLAAACGTPIRPVDSEHSAIWQSIGPAPPSEVARIVLTASGGPFRETPADELATVTAREALAHPTWSMGGKITIDSATLMNKGLEVIEAHWLFGLPYDQISVVVHPQSVIHSLVEFVDGSHIAQLGLPDMRSPIQYALTYPERWQRVDARLDLTQTRALHFEPPDLSRFPALGIAREAGIAGNTYPTALSAADDEAVAAFLANEIRFVDIPALVQIALDQHVPDGPLSLESILATDISARKCTREAISKRRFTP